MALSPNLRAMVSTAKAKYTNTTGATKLKEGRNVFRILRPTQEQAAWVEADGKFWADSAVHWIKADENGKPIVVLGDCETVYGKPSAINTAIQLAIDSAMDEASKKLYESWKPRKSVLLNAIDRGNNDAVVILELTGTTFQKFLEIWEMHLDADEDLTDVTSGKDIVITKTGKGLQTEYSVSVAPGASKPVNKDQMAKLNDLPKYIKDQFFRGEEQKALNAIQQIAGVAVPSLGAARTPTAALTSSGVSVAEPAATKPAPAAAPVVAAAPAIDPELAARRAALQERQRQAAAEAAELAELEASMSAAPVTAATDVVEATGVSVDEEAEIFAELDKLS